jgi:hypothetical protein
MTSETAIQANGSEASKEETMNSENVAPIADESTPAQEKSNEGGLQLRPSDLMAAHHPMLPGDVEIVDTISEAGIRPIGASHLALAGSYSNGRPISASPLRVVEMLPGGRPIFADDFTIVETGMLPGGRPIMASNPHLLESSYLPGGRPIASNDTDLPETLMGFLD